jgi:uncharacterized lipoprotein YbaY
MKRIPLLFALVLLSLLPVACSHVDLTPEGDPSRVLTGTINTRVNLLPPPDTEIVVRIIDTADVALGRPKTNLDVPAADHGRIERTERVVAEQVIHAPASLPAPFRVAYQASDAELRSGLNVDVRISWGGHLRFRTVEAHAVTLSNATSEHAIWVEPLR